MAKYKFHIEKGKIPDDKINKHKDFNKLLLNYRRATKPLTKTPLYKVRNKRFFISLLITLLILFILFSQSLFEENAKRAESVKKMKLSKREVIYQKAKNKTG